MLNRRLKAVRLFENDTKEAQQASTFTKRFFSNKPIKFYNHYTAKAILQKNNERLET